MQKIVLNQIIDLFCAETKIKHSAFINPEINNEYLSFAQDAYMVMAHSAATKRISIDQITSSVGRPKNALAKAKALIQNDISLQNKYGKLYNNLHKKLYPQVQMIVDKMFISKPNPDTVAIQKFDKSKRGHDGSFNKKTSEIHREYLAKLDKAVEIVAEYFHYGTEQIKCVTRRSDIVFPRQCYMVAVREICGRMYSFADIGSPVGKNHATVMHALKAFKNYKDTRDPRYTDYQDMIEKLKRRLKILFGFPAGSDYDFWEPTIDDAGFCAGSEV